MRKVGTSFAGFKWRSKLKTGQTCLVCDGEDVSTVGFAQH